jgi:hypothetical protein
MVGALAADIGAVCSFQHHLCQGSYKGKGLEKGFDSENS